MLVSIHALFVLHNSWKRLVFVCLGTERTGSETQSFCISKSKENDLHLHKEARYPNTPFLERSFPKKLLYLYIRSGKADSQTRRSCIRHHGKTVSMSILPLPPVKESLSESFLSQVPKHGIFVSEITKIRLEFNC